jgi:hypothetical protein
VTAVQLPEKEPTILNPQYYVLRGEFGRNFSQIAKTMLQEAADMAKNDCARAMDLAHRLKLQLRAAEERALELEAEAAHFRDRAAHAEDWLVRIHGEVEQMFFHKKEPQNGRREK